MLLVSNPALCHLGKDNTRCNSTDNKVRLITHQQPIVVHYHHVNKMTSTFAAYAFTSDSEVGADFFIGQTIS